MELIAELQINNVNVAWKGKCQIVCLNRFVYKEIVNLLVKNGIDKRSFKINYSIKPIHFKLVLSYFGIVDLYPNLSELALHLALSAVSLKQLDNRYIIRITRKKNNQEEKFHFNIFLYEFSHYNLNGEYLLEPIKLSRSKVIKNRTTYFDFRIWEYHIVNVDMNNLVIPNKNGYVDWQNSAMKI